MQYDAFGNIERSIHDLFLCKRGNELMYKFEWEESDWILVIIIHYFFEEFIFEKMPPQEKFETSAHLNNSRDNNLNCQNSTDIQIPEANEIKEETKDLDFDELLPYVGEFGLYQKILFILMIPFTSFVAWVYFSQIFITLIPEKYWCWVPELKNLTSNER